MYRIKNLLQTLDSQIKIKLKNLFSSIKSILFHFKSQEIQINLHKHNVQFSLLEYRGTVKL